MGHELTENEKNRIRNLHESYSNHNGSLMLNEEEVMDKQIVALGTKEGPKYCRANEGETGKITKILNKLKEKNPKVLSFVSNFLDKLKNIKKTEGNKGLFKVLKEVNQGIKVAKNKGKQEVNEQVTPIVIAGISFPPSVLIAVSAVVLLLVIGLIINNVGKKTCPFFASVEKTLEKVA